MDDKQLLERVIADTEYHVEHSADADFHRSPDHVEQVLKPHLLRIQMLMDEEQPTLLESAIATLEETNARAALSLSMLVKEIRSKGVEGCLRVCLGQDKPS